MRWGDGKGCCDNGNVKLTSNLIYHLLRGSKMAKNRFNIAVIAGDGIGTEVMPEGLRALSAAAGKFDINLHFDHFDFASYGYYEKHGDMLPEDWQTQIGSHDAIFFGAVGLPDKIPDHISLWGSLLKFRVLLMKF